MPNDNISSFFKSFEYKTLDLRLNKFLLIAFPYFLPTKKCKKDSLESLYLNTNKLSHRKECFNFMDFLCGPAGGIKN